MYSFHRGLRARDSGVRRRLCVVMTMLMLMTMMMRTMFGTRTDLTLLRLSAVADAIRGTGLDWLWRSDNAPLKSHTFDVYCMLCA